MNHRPGIATVALIATLLSTAPAVADCDHGRMHADAPPETRQFAFLIGEFDIALKAWRDGAWTAPRAVGARWNGWWGLNGMAIYDEWYDPGTDDPSGTWGVNVRLFDPHAAVWKMMWIAMPARQVQDLRAEVRDGRLTMWQVHPERPGWKAEFEIVDADHWARVSYTAAPDGGWVPEYRLEATRRPCNL